VLTHLKTAITRLDSTDPDVSPLTALKARRAALLERLAGSAAPALVAGGLWSELAHLDAEIAGLLGRIERAEKAEGVVRGVIAIEPLYVAWKRTAERLAVLESVPLVHADRDAWRLAARRLRKAERLAKGRKKFRAKYARQLRDLPPESVVWSKRAAIAALADEEPRLERLAADVARAESHARLAARRFGEQVGIAGLSRLVPVTLSADVDVDTLPEVLLPEGFALSFSPLRSRARACNRASRDLAAAKKELAEAKRSLGTTRGTVSGAERGLGGVSVQAAIDQAAETDDGRRPARRTRPHHRTAGPRPRRGPRRPADPDPAAGGARRAVRDRHRHAALGLAPAPRGDRLARLRDGGTRGARRRRGLGDHLVARPQRLGPPRGGPPTARDGQAAAG
jgi:hypothetical protein